MIERKNVQVFIFTRYPFKVLILKRTEERGGYYQPVCGGVADHESLQDTVIREAIEETGLKTYKQIIDLAYRFTYDEPKNGVRMHMEDVCFALEVEKPYDVKLSSEHVWYKWCSEEEAKRYLNWEHNLNALNQLVKLIEKS